MSWSIAVTAEAARNLRRLIVVLSLPADTPDRVRSSLEALQRFPEMGVHLTGELAHQRLRVLLGPWRWMLLVYRLDEDRKQVHVVAIEDARMATSVTTRAR